MDNGELSTGLAIGCFSNLKFRGMLRLMKLVSLLPSLPELTAHFPTLTSPSATSSALDSATSRWQADTVAAAASLNTSRSRVATTIAALVDADSALSRTFDAAPFLR